MKKKILLLTFLIFITSLPLMAFSMDIAPYEGSFGVPLGSDDYDGGYNGFDDTPDPENDDGIYNDSEIVAIAEFQDITANDVASPSGQEVKITVSCPNGMFFVSQSNPAFKFPFELQLIWTDESVYDGWTRYTRTVQRTQERTREWDIGDRKWGDWGDWSDWNIPDEEWEKYKYSAYDGWNNITPDVDWWFPEKPESQQKEWYTSQNRNVSEQNPEYILQFRVSNSNEFVVQEQGDVEPSSSGGGDLDRQETKIEKITQIGYMYNTFQEMDLWADIVLVLPGTVANDTVTYNNVVYPLIEADDYTALVTITMEYGGQIKSITIPFSGFYEKGNTVKEESVCSLLVNPYSTAAHLSIAEDRGTWVPVGSLDFMLSTATNTNTTNPVIFASSSSNPEAAADEFRLVHESATFNTPLTQTNSIGFDVRIRNLNADGGTSSYIFDGTATQESVTKKLKNGPSYDTDSGKNQYPSSEDWGGIVPAKIYSKLQHDNAEKSYYLYNGEIEVMMDQGTNVMLEGRYTGTVYIHVIANEKVM